MHLNGTGNAPQTYSIADGTALRAATGNPVEQLGNANNNLLNPATFADPAFKKGSPNENIQFTTQANNHAGVDGVFGKHENDDYLDTAKAAHVGSTRYREQRPGRHP